MFQATDKNTAHAQAARRAVRQMLAAKRRGDPETAAVYAQLVKDSLDRHLATLRGRLP